MKLRDRLLIYLVRKIDQIENDRKELRLNMRSRPMDSLDVYENLRMEIYLEAWDEFTNDLYRIIQMRDSPKK